MKCLVQTLSTEVPLKLWCLKQKK